jgi:hypothetical protein
MMLVEARYGVYTAIPEVTDTLITTPRERSDSHGNW